jgi:hypothetical protein
MEPNNSFPDKVWLVSAAVAVAVAVAVAGSSWWAGAAVPVHDLPAVHHNRQGWLPGVLLRTCAGIALQWLQLQWRSRTV